MKTKTRLSFTNKGFFFNFFILTYSRFSSRFVQSRRMRTTDFLGLCLILFTRIKESYQQISRFQFCFKNLKPIHIYNYGYCIWNKYSKHTDWDSWALTTRCFNWTPNECSISFASSSKALRFWNSIVFPSFKALLSVEKMLCADCISFSNSRSISRLLSIIISCFSMSARSTSFARNKFSYFSSIPCKPKLALIDSSMFDVISPDDLI